jgi:sigma-B regulation protein RsbU (phosphoserine phosphatase)
MKTYVSDGREKKHGAVIASECEMFSAIRNETGILAGVFQKMVLDLETYIENMTKATAEKERIGAELSIATKIQASMLPRIFPPFPDRNEFDIYASMLPAKEVGGDFYDFFMVGTNKLAVVIADVSCKGVPAALFMVVAKTLIKYNAQEGKPLKEVFDTVNNLLCENNDAGMFVTAFMGILDIPTGKFSFVNAGHNAPLIKRVDGKYEFLKIKPALILAAFEGTAYREDETDLLPGDMLYLYTDGVTEAMNTENELFSDPRLLETANRYKDCDVKELLESIKKEVDLFANGAEQADDVTMLALRYKGC